MEINVLICFELISTAGYCTRRLTPEMQMHFNARRTRHVVHTRPRCIVMRKNRVIMTLPYVIVKRETDSGRRSYADRSGERCGGSDRIADGSARVSRCDAHVARAIRAEARDL